MRCTCTTPIRSLLFERLRQSGPDGALPKNLDAAHAFYLGYEMCKAATAITLGKQYQQDEALDWGFLTRPEAAALSCAQPRRHRTERRSMNESPIDDALPLVERLESVARRGRSVSPAGRPAARRVLRQRDAASDSWADIRSSRPIRSSGSPCRRTAATRWRSIRTRIADCRIASPTTEIRNPSLPPFQGGWAGMFGYELGRSLEASAGRGDR